VEIYLTSDELRHLENCHEKNGVSNLQMITEAASVSAEYIKDHYPSCRILILCGKGNNGADGLMLACLLHPLYSVTVYHPYVGQIDSPNAICYKKAKETGVCFAHNISLNEFDLIIDAYYGIGFHLPLSKEVQRIFKYVNNSHLPIISLDIPSGVEADTGRSDRYAIFAHTTLTFTRKKPGLMVYPGADHAGKVVLLDAGIPVPLNVKSPYASLNDLALYPSRPDNSHKGTFGTLAIYAGSLGMAGAAYLAALAAYRTGVGLVKIITPIENRMILQTMLPEAVLVCYDSQSPDFRMLEKALCSCNSLVAGPGIGINETAGKILHMLLSVFDANKTVLDADALNLLAKSGAFLPKGAVITPHPKEFSRLTGENIQDIIAKPLSYSVEFSKHNEVITLLKGARTVIASPSGETRINLSGNNGMATAGSGDVLSGIIGALLTLGLSSFDAASLGAYIHGLAGDHAIKRIAKPSLIASDIVASISDVLLNE